MKYLEVLGSLRLLSSQGNAEPEQNTGRSINPFFPLLNPFYGSEVPIFSKQVVSFLEVGKFSMASFFGSPCHW